MSFRDFLTKLENESKLKRLFSILDGPGRKELHNEAVFEGYT